MPTAEQVFQTSVNKLSRSERLRLAALILQDLAQADPGVLDYSESWTNEDVADLQAHALKCGAEAAEESKLA